MERDPLEQLLRQADRHAGRPPASVPDLAIRVRRSYRRRQQVARTTLACSVGLVVMGSVMYRLWPRIGEASHTSVVHGDASIDQRLDELKAQADQLRLELASLGSETQNQTLPAVEPVPQPSFHESRAQQMERAACLIAYQADRYYRELGMRGQAKASYRHILNHFPNTYAAQSAQARLTELENEKGNRS